MTFTLSVRRLAKAADAGRRYCTVISADISVDSLADEVHPGWRVVTVWRHDHERVNVLFRRVDQ